jgi:hypothetical protein
MAIYQVNFRKVPHNIGDGWTSSVARQTENPNNKSQIANGESEITTRQKAVEKIQKRLEKTDFTEDQIMFNGQRQNSLDDLMIAISRII